ncbi:hypothetical protein QTG54_013661 [Skeletonema marinoi]|uniref:Sulfotransferase domain-containing protein n=1 Tax=Skeletonema marinoi TaxID=267567 RepID=A0AAD8XY04_9STRA|nr:hypothetical protein QTG54_013661 [Skeletonema marinoi]
MSDNHRYPLSSSTTSDNRRNISMPRVAFFLAFLPSLLFNIATMHSSLSKSVDETAYPDYPIREYQQSQQSSASYTNNNHPNPSTTATKLLPTAATHPRGPAPYGCGVVLFFHIPSTGGNSIANWFRKYASPRNGNITFYQTWTRSIGKDGNFLPNLQNVQDAFIEGMNDHVENLDSGEWRSGQYHIVQPPLNSTEDLWYKWRATVESQGCQMINAIMLRDPLNHAMSLYKILNRKNGTREEWMDYLEQPSGAGKWATMLDFFLYNINGPTGRNPYNATKEEKVRRGIELLQRHFDVVSLGDHTDFMNQVLNYTGWKHLDMPHTNVGKKTLEFTKKEVEKLYKLLVKNGDIDFVDAVKQRYNGHLSYLSDV